MALAARPLFGDDVRLAEAAPELADEATLRADERAAIEGAVDKRRAEFATARRLARTLFTETGRPDATLPLDAARAPVWPDGLVGSVSHTAGYCGVVVAPRGDVLGLGLDAEQAKRVSKPVLRAITREEERAALLAHGEEEALRLATWVFAAKEAAYKAQYALTATYLGFSAMRIELEGNAFRAVFAQAVGGVFEPGDVLEGRFSEVPGLVLAGVTIRESRPWRRPCVA